MGRPGHLPPNFVPSIANMPVDHERAANAWAELESSTEPPLPHPKERRRKKRVLASLPDDEEPPSPVAAAGLRGSIQEPASAAAPSSSSPIIAPSKRLAIRGPSGSPSRCARLACCGCGALTCAAGGRSRARRVVRIGVPLVLLALIFWLLSYSGFQHDFLRVSSNSQYKTDFPLSLCAIALASVLLRMPTVVRQLQRRRYSVWAVAEKRGVPWLLPLLFLLLVFAGGILNRIRGGMTGPMWGLCDGHHDVKGDDRCGGWGDFVGRWGISLASGLLVGLLGGGNPLLGVWFAWFMYLGNVPDWGCYFTMADGPGGPHGHEDCAHEQRRGMFDWLIGKADFMADQSYEVRLMRDWCGMWMRGLVWLGPAGLGVRAAGFDYTLAIGGSLMPLFYKMDTWFTTKAADFGVGSPEGELIWGFAMYAMLVACMLGSGERQAAVAAAATATPAVTEMRDEEDGGGNGRSRRLAAPELRQPLLTPPDSPSASSSNGGGEFTVPEADLSGGGDGSAETEAEEEAQVLASLLCADPPAPRALLSTLNLRIRQASEVIAWGSLVCTLIGAVCAHIADINHKAWG